MKNYKDFEKTYIGSSDVATLVLSGAWPLAEETNDPAPIKLKALAFAEDGNYNAYVVDGDTEIGAHYQLVATFEAWMQIYDDDGLTQKFVADEIRVYRAGEFGCIIQLCAC